MNAGTNVYLATDPHTGEVWRWRGDHRAGPGGGITPGMLPSQPRMGHYATGPAGMGWVSALLTTLGTVAVTGAQMWMMYDADRRAEKHAEHEEERAAAALQEARASAQAKIDQETAALMQGGGPTTATLTPEAAGAAVAAAADAAAAEAAATEKKEGVPTYVWVAGGGLALVLLGGLALAGRRRAA